MESNSLKYFRIMVDDYVVLRVLFWKPLKKSITCSVIYYLHRREIEGCTPEEPDVFVSRWLFWPKKVAKWNIVCLPRSTSLLILLSLILLNFDRT